MNKLSTKILGKGSGMDQLEQNKIWKRLLEYIKDQISLANFKTWFSQTKLGELKEEKITILVPSAFIQGQLASRYEQLIKAGLEHILGKQFGVLYQVDSSLLAKKTQEPGPVEDFFQPVSTPQNAAVSPLNPKYSLDNFVVGPTNNLAYAASQAVVQNPGVSYNPLFIYGPSGVGKTHLMQAVGNVLLQKNPYLKIVYASSERFMVDFVDSLQTKRTGEFRSKYRQCDILLIDDVQFIAGKDSTQEEFFHTFNELHAKNSQIILTSDRPPNEMQKLESRLMSRFQGGLMVDIQLPDFETRVAILKAKLKERGDNVPDEVINAIAESVQSNTRELEGKLIQLIQMSKLLNQPLSLVSAQPILGKSTPSIPLANQIDYKKILNIIIQYFNLKTADILGPRRQKELVLPRQIAMYLMYEECKMPFEKIGQVLGGRDHTTVMHGVEKIKEAVQRDREVQRLLIEVKQQLFH